LGNESAEQAEELEALKQSLRDEYRVPKDYLRLTEHQQRRIRIELARIIHETGFDLTQEPMHGYLTHRETFAPFDQRYAEDAMCDESVVEYSSSSRKPRACSMPTFLHLAVFSGDIGFVRFCIEEAHLDSNINGTSNFYRYRAPISELNIAMQP